MCEAMSKLNDMLTEVVLRRGRREELDNLVDFVISAVQLLDVTFDGIVKL